MDVTGFVSAPVSDERRACAWVLIRNLDHVLVGMVVVGMMQMTVVEVVDVVSMPNGCVSAAGA